MIDHKNYPINYIETLRATKIIYKYLSPTSLIQYQNLSSLVGAEIFVKHENQNPTGSFKIRGSINLMHHLKQKGAKGVITFSTGNHGFSVAQSAVWLGIDVTVVVPKNNNPVKNKNIKQTGATLIESGKTFEEASLTVEGKRFVNPICSVGDGVYSKNRGLQAMPYPYSEALKL